MMIELVTAAVACLAVLRVRLNEHVTDVARIVQMFAQVVILFLIAVMLPLVVDCWISRVRAHAAIPIVESREE